MLDQYKLLENHLLENGYLVLDVNSPELIISVRNQVLAELKKITGHPEITLENYHSYFQDDKDHFNTQVKMTNFFRSTRFHTEIIRDNQDFFRFLLGPDLDVQNQAYLRMARPSKTQDNIGYHRDTYYGTAASELSVFVPFVDLTEESSLSIYPTSHVMPDSQFETESSVSKDVTKGSEKNKIGFLYAPRVIKTDITPHMKPIPLKVGQIMVFMLSTIHGSIVNSSTRTRWSTDIRVKNHFYDLNETMKENYYQAFSRSAVLTCSERYSSKEVVV